MKRNNILFIVGSALLVVVLVNLRAPTSTPATVLAAHPNAAGSRLSADDLSVQPINTPSRLTSALTSDSGNEPCYPGTSAADRPSVYPVRAFLPLIVAPRFTLTCAHEVEPNDTHLAAQAVTAACVAASASDSGEADWYALRLCSPMTLTVRTKGALISALDLKLYLHGDPPGVPIASSKGVGLGELVSARLLMGMYYVRVQPVRGSGAYELWIEAHR